MATFKLELPSYANAKDDLTNDNEKTEIKSKENEEGISKDDNKGNVGLPEASSSQKLSTEEDRRKREVILMDGPLSRIYTEALNMVYIKPFNKQVEIPTDRIWGTTSNLYIFGIEVSRVSSSYADFCEQMKEKEEDFIKSILV